MATTNTRLMTFAEFEQLPDEVCRRHELRRMPTSPASPAAVSTLAVDTVFS